MTKIFIDRSANVAQAVEQTISAEDASVVLVIPRNADIASAQENFELLKREAAAAGKTIFVESVDEDALRRAERSGIEAVHPLFAASGGPRRALTDIVLRERGESGELAGTPKSAKRPKLRATTPKKNPVEKRAEPVARKEEETEDEPYALAGKEGAARDDSERRTRGSWRWAAWVAVVVCVAGSGVWGTGRVFGRASVSLNFKKTAWHYEQTVAVTKTATKPGGNTVPGEVLTEERNLTELFPASSRAQVSARAKGKMLVFNGYSSSPQALVASTRFATPDGKVFRLDSALTVPGAGIKDGKIIPASIEAAVTADQPGSEYNTGPVERLTIPGFKGTPKYEGFYGQLAGSVDGGFVGEKAVPTDDDIKKAKDRTTELLRTSLANDALRGLAKEFTVLPNTREFSVVRLVVNRNTDDKGNFSIFGEARTRAVAFRKADVEEMLSADATEGSATLALQGIAVEYSDPKTDFVKGEMKMRVKASGTITAKFDGTEFAKTVAGKRIEEARAHIKELPELVNATISLWPFWLGSVPSNPAKVHVSVE